VDYQEGLRSPTISANLIDAYKGDKIIPNQLIDLHKWKSCYDPGAKQRVVKDQIVASQVNEEELPESLSDSKLPQIRPSKQPS